MKWNIFAQAPKSEDKFRTRQVSQLRRDLVTDAWVVLANLRAKRRKSFIKHSVSTEKTSRADCPFEDPQASGNGEPLLMYGDKNNWRIQVISNKYPAFAPNGQFVNDAGVCKRGCSHIEKVGPYTIRDGYGFHEVVITRDHDKYFALFSHQEAKELIKSYIQRYKFLKTRDCVKFISIFNNHGAEAGASIYHPHSQIIAVPFLPSDIKRSLSGSKSFYKKHKECPHCIAINWEKKEGVRLIYENNNFIVFCPFVSFGGFEIRIFPKKHQSDFDKIDSRQYGDLGDALRIALSKLDKALHNPPFNFFIHTSPVGTKEDYSFYHWHIEILPKLAIDAGFELGTGVQITTISPEDAAKILQETA